MLRMLKFIEQNMERISNAIATCDNYVKQLDECKNEQETELIYMTHGMDCSIPGCSVCSVRDCPLNSPKHYNPLESGECECGFNISKKIVRC
jgi:hypothetical protein